MLHSYYKQPEGLLVQYKLVGTGLKKPSQAQVVCTAQSHVWRANASSLQKLVRLVQLSVHNYASQPHETTRNYHPNRGCKNTSDVRFITSPSLWLGVNRSDRPVMEKLLNKTLNSMLQLSVKATVLYVYMRNSTEKCHKVTFCAIEYCNPKGRLSSEHYQASDIQIFSRQPADTVLTLRAFEVSPALDWSDAAKSQLTRRWLVGNSVWLDLGLSITAVLQIAWQCPKSSGPRLWRLVAPRWEWTEGLDLNLEFISSWKSDHSQASG